MSDLPVTSREFQSRARALSISDSGEIDLELLTFVERYATTLTRWDLLLYFGRNPSTRDNALAIARQVGRRQQTIEKELEDLTYLGVLAAHQNGNGMIYQLSKAQATRRAVIRLAQCYDGPPAT